MASETHNVKKRNFCNKIEDHFIDLPRKKISNFTNKNMKEVKKSPKQLAAYINRTVGQTLKSPDKLRKVIYRRKKVHHPFPNPCYRKKQSPGSGGCDMANKENELACASHLPEKLHHDSRTYLVNSSDSGSSQTESPSSKYSGFFSEDRRSWRCGRLPSCAHQLFTGRKTIYLTWLLCRLVASSKVTT
uniref:Katanin regulatory subunit B1 like 1 n=2 Tax=Macaca TaxID=9539 RepID=A0A5F7ZMK7_MACMU